MSYFNVESDLMNGPTGDSIGETAGSYYAFMAEKPDGFGVSVSREEFGRLAMHGQV